MIRVAVLATALCLAAPDAVADPAGTIDGRIAEAMALEGIPGLQAVVVKNGRVIFAKSYGYAVLDQPGPRRAMQDDTVLFGASVTKLLVSIAVFQQFEQGLLKLDDDIGRSVSFRVRNPAWPDVPITWRMLLTHTSSFDLEDDERSNEFSFYGRDPPMSLGEFVSGNFTPGTRYYWPQQYRPGRPGTERIYSNNGFSLMAVALESIVHEPFDRYIQHAILDPLKMTHSGVRFAHIDPDKVAVGYASLKEGEGRFRFVPNKAYWAHGDSGGRAIDHYMTCPDYPSGCWHITALDFARLLMALMNRGAVEGVRLLRPSSVDLMMTATGFRGPVGWPQGVGLLGAIDYRGRAVWGHDGEDRGAANAVFFNPRTGVGGIILTNAMDPAWTQAHAVGDLDYHLMSWFE